MFPSFVYCLSSPYIDKYGYKKLGLTTHPVHRMRTYNTGDPPNLGLEKRYDRLWRVRASTFRDLHRIESHLHSYFQQFRIYRSNGKQTEWFQVTLEQVIEFLSSQSYMIEELSLEEIEEIHRQSESKLEEADTASIQDEIEFMNQQEIQFKLQDEAQILKQKFKTVFLNTFEFRRIQSELWDTFLEICQTDILNYRGIVQWPTGTGKTVAMLMLIVLMKHWCERQGKLYRGLLVSPKNDIFDTIKGNFKGLTEFGIHLVDGSNGQLSKVSIPNTKHVLIFACHASLTNPETVDKLPPINHAHYDEVHRIGGEIFFGLLKTKMQTWKTEVLTGTSATPHTASAEQRRKISELFGDPLQILHRCNIDEAVCEGWIARPQFNICCLPKVKREALLELFADSIVKAIEEKGGSRKHIAYVKDSTEDVMLCYKHIQRHHKDIELFHAIEGEERNDDMFQYHPISESKASLLLACQRYLEGSDIKGLESTAILIGDTVSAHSLLQIIGRALRLDYVGKVGICTIAKAVDEGVTEDDVLASIVLDIIDILGVGTTVLEKKNSIKRLVETYIGDVSVRGSRLSIQETIERIQAAYLRKIFTERSYKEKYSVLQDLNRELGLSSKHAYFQSVSRHPNFIENPRDYFGENWVSWYDFLGIDTSVFPKTKAEFITECKKRGLINEKEYKSARPETLPERPIDLYSDWTTWGQEFEIEDEIVW